MLKYNKLLGFFFLIILIISCKENNLSQNDKLIGTWTRVGDNYARMRVTIEKKDNKYVGKIIFLPTLAQKNGFVFNDVKWKKIKKINNNKYSLLNLDVTVNTFGDRVKEEYNKCFVYFTPKDKIKIDFKDDDRRVQYWVKINQNY